jgi:hypothetical protein
LRSGTQVSRFKLPGRRFSCDLHRGRPLHSVLFDDRRLARLGA